MFLNYLKIALRGFRRDGFFTFINIAGLSLGISAALVIYLIVQHDFSFDKFHKDRDRIYHIVTDFKFSGQPYYNSGVPAGMNTAVKNEITGIETSALFFQYNWDTKLTVPSANPEKAAIYKKVSGVIFADEYYFRIFSYKWLAGSPQAALREPNKLVLSEKKARKYFPSGNLQDVIGQTVYYNDSIKTTIAGVVKDFEDNTDINFTEFISLATIPNSGLKDNVGWESWGTTNGNTQLFIKLAAGISPASVKNQLVAVQKKYKKSEGGNSTVFNLQPLSGIHFTSDYGTNYSEHLANKKVLYGLIAVAIFILLLGCINFINLTTAQAAQRAKEIGVRKTMGSTGRQLIGQFLSETLLLTTFATILAFLLAPVIIKLFADFTPPQLPTSIYGLPHVFLFALLLIMVVALLSGFYPALVLAKFNPVLVLKNQAYANTNTSRKAWLRKTLTVSQFVIAQFFIIATLVVSKQIHYSLTRDMGFRKEAIINFDAPFFDRNPDRRFVLLDKFKSIPEVSLASMGGSTPASGNTWSGEIRYLDGKKEIATDVQFKMGDSNYLKLYQLKLVAGVAPIVSDTPRDILINETYARLLGFAKPSEVLGKYLNWSGKQLPVTGVLADFHQRSFHESIKPMAFMRMKGNHYTYHIAMQANTVNSNNWKSALAKMEAAWKLVYPEEEFSYEFYDKSIEGFYKSEQNLSKLLKWATGICIFISCLGLLGLVMYTTNLRIKEIGVRKVLGASVVQVVILLSKDFLRLVLIAFIIASPLAWWGMNEWLQSFAYRTSMSWWIFGACGGSMALASLVVVGMRTVKASIANPVNALRSE